MSSLKNDLIIKAMLREPTPRTPVWIMRQAGRYLPEYRKVRKKAGSFLRLAKNPNFATEVTLQPLQRYDLDAAILFSDILTIPDAMGLGLYFVDGEGPCFEKPLRNEKSINSLTVPNPQEKLSYVLDTVNQVKKALCNSVPLIGFAGSPFTLACYQIEGRGGSDFSLVKKMLYQSPALLHKLLEVNTLAVTDYLNAQIAAGVNAVMIFDSWGGILSRESYIEFSLKYLKLISSKINRFNSGEVVPRILFARGSAGFLDIQALAGFDTLGVDWQTDLGFARKMTRDKVSIQGNLDPSVLLSSSQVIRSETTKVLDSFGEGDGHVFNLGHGISKDTSPDSVHTLLETVGQKSPKYH